MRIELGEYREAGVWADKALELSPEHPELLALKALACVRDAKRDRFRVSIYYHAGEITYATALCNCYDPRSLRERIHNETLPRET